MQCCFFEDEVCNNFKPLSLTRPVDDLRTGILTIGEKWRIALNVDRWSRTARPELAELFSVNTTDNTKPCLWINSRYLPTSEILAHIDDLEPGAFIKDGDAVAIAMVDADTSAQLMSEGTPDFSSFTAVSSSQFCPLNYLWDLFLMNEDEIAADLKLLNYPSSGQNSVSDHSILQNRSQIFIGEGAQIKPGAILTAEEGPLYIGKNAAVLPGAIIEGPAAVCEGAVVKPGAKIHSNTTIGPVCKAGGEVADSVFHSYSNKGHEGYAGNSLIGQWCNLGAGTNISNLKNNYSPVRFTDWQSGKPIETNQQFLGTVMGDHSKTAINTRLNTGTAVGVSCNVFSADFPPKYIPSFSWVSSHKIQPYKLKKALEAMQAMMTRRNVELTEEYKKLMRTIYGHEYGV